MRYEGPLYRPPSEARSLIVQATIGCSHNKCIFCSMYKNDKFKIRSTDEIIEDLIKGREYYRQVKRVFLADGDALIIKTKELVKILEAIKTIMPECERVGIYGSPNSISIKTKEELLKLRSLGLGIIYLGLESGSDKVLKYINKGVNSLDMIEAGKKVVDSNIKLSVTLISGIGGRENSMIHAIESANILNHMKPDYIGLLTLLLNEDTQLYDDIQNKKFEPLTPEEILEETKILVERLEIENCVFRSNHPSNYVALRGTLMADKQLILAQIEEGLHIGKFHEKELYRRF